MVSGFLCQTSFTKFELCVSLKAIGQQKGVMTVALEVVWGSWEGSRFWSRLKKAARASKEPGTALDRVGRASEGAMRAL